MPSAKVRGHRAMTERLGRVGYGECSRHLSYQTRQEARRALKRHTEAVRAGRLACWKCRAGREPAVFACHDWRAHHHWGHA